MTRIIARATFEASYSGSYSRKIFVVLSKPIHCTTLHIELFRRLDFLSGSNCSFVSLRQKLAAEIVVGLIAAGTMDSIG